MKRRSVLPKRTFLAAAGVVDALTGLGTILWPMAVEKGGIRCAKYRADQIAQLAPELEG
jgi:hypothetical protein